MEWKDILDFNQEEIFKFLEDEQRKRSIYPDPNRVFLPFREVPLDILKLIIIGPHPYAMKTFYSDKGKRLSKFYPFDNGIPFSVDNGLERPKLLKDLLEDFPKVSNELTDWLNKGILPLYRTLTAPLGRKRDHLGIWDDFIQSVIDNTDVPVFLIGKDTKHLEVPSERKWYTDYPDNFENHLPELFELLEL